MINDILSTFWPLLREAFSELIVVAFRGGFLIWGVFMGKLLGTGFYEKPSHYKVVFISMPLAVLTALFFSFWSYKWIVNPGETRVEALHDAGLTFFFVLLPLWSGCLWGIIEQSTNKVDRRQISKRE